IGNCGLASGFDDHHRVVLFLAVSETWRERTSASECRDARFKPVSEILLLLFVSDISGDRSNLSTLDDSGRSRCVQFGPQRDLLGTPLVPCHSVIRRSKYPDNQSRIWVRWLWNAVVRIYSERSGLQKASRDADHRSYPASIAGTLS